MESQRGVTLVTGSNGGVGSNLVRNLLERGRRELVCQYHESCETITAILASQGLDPASFLVQADLTSEIEVKAMHDEIREKFGNVWGVVNLAGVSTNAVSWKLSLADFRRVLDGNLLTAFLTAREFIPEMRASEGGRIINISSVVAHIGAFGAAHYSAAKSAVLGLTRSLALELASKKITVNALSLGYFKYGMITEVPEPQLEQIRARIPLNRLGEIQEIGGLVEFLLGADSSYITGQTLHINGGQFL